MYILSAESATNFFNEERLLLKNAVLTRLTALNNGINSTNAETLEIQTLRAAQFLTK